MGEASKCDEARNFVYGFSRAKSGMFAHFFAREIDRLSSGELPQSCRICCTAPKSVTKIDGFHPGEGLKVGLFSVFLWVCSDLRLFQKVPGKRRPYVKKFCFGVVGADAGTAAGLTMAGGKKKSASALSA